MLKSIAHQSPDLAAVTDNSIASTPADNAGSPLQAAFAELLAEISSPQVTTVTVQPNTPATVTAPVPAATTATAQFSNSPADGTAPVDPAVTSAPAPSSSTTNIAGVPTTLRIATKPASSTPSKPTDDTAKVPAASLFLLVHNPSQFTTNTDVPRFVMNSQPAPVQLPTTASVDPAHISLSTGQTLPPEALANSIHVEVESTTQAPAPKGVTTSSLKTLQMLTWPMTLAHSTVDADSVRAKTASVNPEKAVSQEAQPQTEPQSPETMGPSKTPPLPADAPQTAAATMAVPEHTTAAETNGGAAQPNLRPDFSAPVATADVVTRVATSNGEKPLSQDSNGDAPKHNLDSSDKTPSALNPTVTSTQPKFDSHLAAPEPTQSATPVREMPEMQTPASAHKISIDIGDKDSKVLVTLHERAGDVSVKIHAANDTLKTQLQSSVGSLVESLNRANVSLKNVDFSSGYGASPQDRGEQHSDNPHTSKSRKNPPASQPQPQTPSEDSVTISTL